MKRTPPAGDRMPPPIFSIREAGILLIILIAAINYFFIPQISFSLLCLLIAIFVTWNCGRKAGIIAMLLSLPAPFLIGIHQGDRLGILCANLSLQSSVSLLLVYMVSTTRDSVVSLGQRVAGGSKALEREINDRRHSEERLHKSVQQFRQLSENIADVFWMRDLDSNRMAYVSPAYEKIWGRSCKSVYQSTDAWLDAVHPEDRETVSQAMQMKEPIEEYNLEYRIIMPDGGLRWIRDRAFPIHEVSGKIIRMVGVAEDITERRRLEREILEISDGEQARIGQDLHDGLCQKLVSIAFDNNTLEKRLSARGQPEATAARQMGDLLDDAITEARALSQGLFPVQLEADGLHLALQQLAASTNIRTKVDCHLECPPFEFIPNNTVAIHLYRIAQEAVNNALKHSQASTILIQFTASGRRIELRISDNGVGIPVSQCSAGGMGLHIMDYRARTIGGSLKVERAVGGGTIVICVAPHPTD